MVEATWWGADPRVLHRVLSDQLYAELARLRLGSAGGPPPWMWTENTAVGGEDAGVDSLDVLSLSASVAELLPEGDIRAACSQRFGNWCEAAVPASPDRLAHVTFRSSGSTGAPRRATHRLDRLEEEAAAFAELIGERRRVLCAIPSHHAYGFIHSVLVPRRLRGLSDPAAVIELRGCLGSQVASLLGSGDLVLGHPMFWDAVLRGIAGRLPPDIVGVTSSAPCPDDTAHGLRAAGLARLVQVYGSAETAGIGWRDDPEDLYQLLPVWRRLGEAICRDGQPVPTPDRLAWVGDRFHVLGRHDGAVQVGGINVSPEEVALALGRHPSVAAVTVRMMRPDEGARLKAFVVPARTAGNVEVLQAELRRFARANLHAAQRPSAYNFGETLPRGAMGKLADWISSGTSDASE